MGPAAAVIAAALAVAAPDTLPPYMPGASVAGEIRVWGSPADRALLQDWEDGFRKFHPGARLVATLHGPESTMAGLYTDVADVAFLAREMRMPTESMAFEWVKLYKPFLVEVANAGIRTDRPAACLAVYVHRDNPLTRLTLAQLEGMFGAERKRGPANLRTWGQTGAAGPWRERPIHVHGPQVDSIPAIFFRQAVLDDSFKWNPDLREHADGVETLAALAGDPDGIAYAPASAANPRVKALDLPREDGGSFAALSAESVRDRSYPLVRVVTMAVNRAPGKPLAPHLGEFLRFVLSREGQDAVSRDGAYVPLGADSVRQQLKRLE